MDPDKRPDPAETLPELIAGQRDRTERTDGVLDAACTTTGAVTANFRFTEGAGMSVQPDDAQVAREAWDRETASTIGPPVVAWLDTASGVYVRETASTPQMPNDGDELARLRAEVEELRASLTELAPSDEVLVEGSYFQRSDLPRILGNFMRSCDDNARDAKSEYLERRSAEAALTRVRDALAVLDEVAFAQIAFEKVLTILPTGPNRAQVPGHWREQTEERVRPYREHLTAALDGPSDAQSPPWIDYPRADL